MSCEETNIYITEIGQHFFLVGGFLLDVSLIISFVCDLFFIYPAYVSGRRNQKQI